MVATVGSIVVAFSADLRRYEASLRAGEKRTNDFERRAMKATTGVGQAFMRMGGLAKAGLAGLATGIVAGGITGLVGQFGAVARSIAEIGDQAKLAGVSVRTFQEWRHVASQARIPVDAMADAFKELAIRADEFATTGKGSAADAFGRIGLSRQEVKERLKDPAELMTLIIERTRQLGDTAAGVRIFDEILGGQGGEQFVRLIEDGEAGIRRTIQEAHDLNAVMSDDMVKSAAELDRRFNALATAVGTNLKSAIVSAADSLVDFINKFRDFEAQKDYQLQDALSDMGKQRLEIERQMIDIREMQRNMVPDASGGYTWAAELGRWQAELDKIAADEERIIGILNSRKERMEKPTDRTWKPIDIEASKSAEKERDKAAKAAEREAEAVRRLIGELEHELSIIGATALEQDIANTLRQAGAAATDDQRAKIISLITAIHAEEEARRQAADATALYRDIASGVMNDLRSALSDGKLEWEELADVALRALDRIVDKLLNDVLDAIFQVGKAGSGMGGGGDFLGTLGTLNLMKGN